MHDERVGCLIMADSILSQSSQDVLRSLDEQLKECTPLDERPGEQGHGLDYAVRMEEAIKVNNMRMTTITRFVVKARDHAHFSCFIGSSSLCRGG